MPAAVLLALALLLGLAPGAAAAETFGRSALGAPLEVERVGDPAAPRRVLVVGSIHGTETAGHAVVARLRRITPPAGVQLWLVRTVNPDGVARETRQNARGTDLNRNFPFRWRAIGAPFDTFFPGRAPASEPETRAVQRLVRAVRPDLTVWYHQAMRLVVLTPGADNALVRAYGGRTGLPPRHLPAYRGTATSWQNHGFGGSAFVVELPAGRLTAAGAARHARAVLAAARERAAAARLFAARRSAARRPVARRSAAPRSAARRPVARRSAAPRSATAPKPPVQWRPIPFGARRKAQMRAYSRRHYGVAEVALRRPKVIVEHYTASTTFASAFNTFARNAPDVEFGELPGVCAHFVVDRDGTVSQLVSLRWRCRHTVGLNDVAIGIEHVGVSDADVMGRPAQLDASLRLTRWLQGRYGIAAGNVIGHAESLSSPYHHERVAAMRRRTHGDFQPATMRRYRARL